MRAVVYRGANYLRLETVPVPRIQSDELLVKVAACGVCPTDIKKIQYGSVPPPRIFGHETAGTISQVGARLKGYRIGERVALHHHVPCLDCHACRHRAFAQCAQYKRTGITAAELQPRLRADGLDCSSGAPFSLRLVTHLDVSADDIDRAVAIFRAHLT